ncbi:MAG: lysylphosphatidylglycerol synthase transmembrane domain-containing protein [Chloroflexota bacterium]|nr:lysylphosphatidylglycerol synthase transmembrane domain-containing protein [Chloroflexota bacterium]
MKKRGMNVLRVLVSVGALSFLFWKIGLGETLAVLRQSDLRYLLAAFLLYVLSLAIRAVRWFVLLRGLDPTVPFGRLLRLYFVGAFFNTFLPTVFGGDVVRALELTQDTDSAAAIGTVLLDRMTGLLMLFVMGLAVLPFHAARMEPWLVWLLLAVAGGGLVVGGLVLEGRFLRRLTRRLPAALSLAGQGQLAGVYAAVTGCGGRAVLSAFGISVVFNVVNVVINWLCGQALGAGIGLGYFFAVTPLLSVSGLIPSIGGWGVREAVSTAVFAPAGAGASVSLALGMSLNGVALAAGLIGGVVYGIEGLRGLRKQEPV